jgi:hypothetical protein
MSAVSAPPDGAPIYLLRLRPLPGTDPIRALRIILKLLLRRANMRCISVEQERTPNDR